MPGFEGLGRILIYLGLFLVLIGLLMVLGGRVFGLGRLPGDILIRRGNFTFYFPLATSLLLSLILTLVFSWLARR
ncbi:MAG: DUF2905 domain-containing protein [Firmicutes bacterium]|nr:DUF2905 domain-containing protein [Bacillota bacterium]MCL5038584.1 DUF2905 domain-containing protein [Bacillota bacterium]